MTFGLPPQPRNLPVRPAKPNGEVYFQDDLGLEERLTFRTLDIERDLQLFNRWQNDPRVLYYWDEGGTLEDHLSYLNKVQKDPHIYSLVACFNDEPFAYIEVYWAKEDRIAPFCAARDYDRGFHVLVGEERFLGRNRTNCWMSALIHYIFLDDSRTSRIVVEPRADNKRVQALLGRHGFILEKYFEFPHKTAALMTLSREAFQGYGSF